MLSKSLFLFKLINIYNILEISIIIIIVFTFLVSPIQSYSQTENPDQIIEETKNFLRKINSSRGVQYGAIIVAPRTPQLEDIFHATPRGVENIPQEPHSQFIISKEVNLNRISLVFPGRRINIRDEVPLNNDLNGRFIVLRLDDISSVGIDTFQIKQQPPKIEIDTIYCKEKRDFLKTLGFSLLPGGGRFHARKYWKGTGMAILQLASIGLAIYCNNQRQEYWNLTEMAALNRDQTKLDENYDKYKNFHYYTVAAIGAAIATNFLNVRDVLINVKNIDCRLSLSVDGIRVNIERKL